MSSFLQDKWSQGISYADYRALIQEKLAQNQTTGSNQSEEMVQYTRLNEQRMHRLDKTVRLHQDLKGLLLKLNRKYHWLVLTEAWCGDAAQSLPVIAAISEVSPFVELRLLLRDEHLDLMDQYLTKGGRSIPKLIAIDVVSGEAIGTWGSRPKAAQELMLAERANPDKTHADVAKDLQLWYARNKTADIQAELMACLMDWEKVRV
jgi:hypothetical protein